MRLHRERPSQAHVFRDIKKSPAEAGPSCIPMWSYCRALSLSLAALAAGRRISLPAGGRLASALAALLSSARP